ncbi:glycosyltransferase family 2 protein [Subtercola sp. YIM 133946]|uniref:glycosyltransferase family 2 protein n=1 Tax=Subtercola sp. YIM 133946 TaxID=3118909 RepID=UPI002F94E47E
MPTIEFDEVGHPVCSIVILAWRLTDVLIECLQSIAASVDAPAYEVVIVLNGATGEVRQTIAEGVSGARLVDLAHNVGFGGGCNAGASVSRGEYIVFLNDDTIVEPNWLRTLHAAAADAPEVGAVASVLLNVDGTLQEAGSRVREDTGTVQFGRGLTLAEAEARGLLVVRSIDYGSAAAVLVRASAFRELSGFDPVYEPAYFEDVDLQFRLKAAGYDVVLEPAARVVHRSGASTDASPVYRSWAHAHSKEFFRERWAAVLATAPAEDAPVSALCVIEPQPDLVNGGRPLSTAAEISAGAAVTALSMAQGFGEWSAAHYEEALADYLRVEKLYYDTEALWSKRVDKLSDLLEERAVRIAELESTVDELTVEADRLHDLNTRSPVGIAKWQAGQAIARIRRGRTE